MQRQISWSCILIFGLHVHVGVENRELAISLVNQLRSWLPHLLALSTNSPFWAGRFTGIKAYRSVIWRPFPRSGVPEPYNSSSDSHPSPQHATTPTHLSN